MSGLDLLYRMLVLDHWDVPHTRILAHLCMFRCVYHWLTVFMNCSEMFSPNPTLKYITKTMSFKVCFSLGISDSQWLQMYNLSLEVHRAECLWELGQRMLGPILAWSFVAAFMCQNSFMEMKTGWTQVLPDEGWPTGRINWCLDCEASNSLSTVPFSCNIFHLVFSCWCCWYTNLSHALSEWTCSNVNMKGQVRDHQERLWC